MRARRALADHCGMRPDALRTLLVLAERPHPWAFLRDRLDPELVSVAWARPAEAGPAIAGAMPAPWLLAGTGTLPAVGLDPLRRHLLACRWVGPAPPGLPAPAVLHDDWRSLAAAVESGLAARLGGLRLAPGRGLVLPDGSFLSSAPELEVLLAAHPDGVGVASDADARAARRRAAAQLERHRLQLEVAHRDGRLYLEPPEPWPAGGRRAAFSTGDGRAP
jgi:hypothetical protein